MPQTEQVGTISFPFRILAEISEAEKSQLKKSLETAKSHRDIPYRYWSTMTLDERVAAYTEQDRAEQKGRLLLGGPEKWGSRKRWAPRPRTIFKLEGGTDFLAFASINNLGSIAVQGCTNIFGSMENPAHINQELMEEVFGGNIVYIMHDADKAGQEGAMWTGKGSNQRPGWGPFIAQFAAETYNVIPGLEDPPGSVKDFRDMICRDQKVRTLEWLMEYCQRHRVLIPCPSKEELTPKIDYEVDDPTYLAKANLIRYEAAHPGAKLKWWNGSFYRWKKEFGCYRHTDPELVKAHVINTIDAEYERDYLAQLADKERESAPRKKKNSTSTTKCTMDKLKSIGFISDSMRINSWLPTGERRNLISFRNGILDLDAFLYAASPAAPAGGARAEEGIFFEHTPNWFSTTVLNYDWDESFIQGNKPLCPRWLKFLEESMQGDQEKIAILQEWAGYLLTYDTNEQKFLVCEGEGANGKSVYFAGIRALIGDKNCSYVTLDEMSSDRFCLGEMYGKLVNMIGDQEEIDRVAEGRLKMITDGSPMSIYRKYMPAIQDNLTARMMMSWNNRPRLRDRTMGLWRRMILIEWKYVVPSQKRNPGYADARWWEDSGELPGMFFWALAGLVRLRTQRGFTRCASSEELIEQYRMESNPVKIFCEEMLQESTFESIEKQDLYKKYQEWSVGNGFSPMSAPQFWKEIRRCFPRTSDHKPHGMPRHIKGIAFST